MADSTVKVEWTHAICVDCWNERNPDRRAHAVRRGDAETCCYCGMPTGAGIFVRAHPSEVACGGDHGR